MRIAIMQPGYLPWLGFFELMHHCDLFVIFDDVQYTKKDWRSRNKIRTKDGWMWLTVPVQTKDRRFQLINEAVIDHTSNWRQKHIKSVEVHYGKARYLKEFFPAFKEIVGFKWERLVDLDLELIKWLAGALGIRRDIVMSSSLKTTGGREEKIIAREQEQRKAALEGVPVAQPKTAAAPVATPQPKAEATPAPLDDRWARLAKHAAAEAAKAKAEQEAAKVTDRTAPPPVDQKHRREEVGAPQPTPAPQARPETPAPTLAPTVQKPATAPQKQQETTPAPKVEKKADRTAPPPVDQKHRREEVGAQTVAAPETTPAPKAEKKADRTAPPPVDQKHRREEVGAQTVAAPEKTQAPTLRPFGSLRPDAPKGKPPPQSEGMTIAKGVASVAVAPATVALNIADSLAGGFCDILAGVDPPTPEQAKAINAAQEAAQEAALEARRAQNLKNWQYEQAQKEAQALANKQENEYSFNRGRQR